VASIFLNVMCGIYGHWNKKTLSLSNEIDHQVLPIFCENLIIFFN
jgi:hypothetical protein